MHCSNGLRHIKLFFIYIQQLYSNVLPIKSLFPEVCDFHRHTLVIIVNGGGEDMQPSYEK